MSVDKIVEKIIEDTHNKAKEIIEEATDKAKQILVEAEREADKKSFQIIDAAKREAEYQAHKLIVAARLKAQKETLLEKRRALDRVFAEVEKRISSKFHPKKILVLKDREVQGDYELSSFLNEQRMSLELEVVKILGLPR